MLCSAKHPYQLSGPLSQLLTCVPGAYFPDSKVDHLSAVSSNFTNEWSYTAAPACGVCMCTGTALS